MEITIFEIIMLILRVGLILLLFFFVILVINTINKELNFVRQRSQNAPSFSSQASMVYATENYAAPQAAATEQGRLLVTEIGNATTVQVGNIFDLRPVTPIGRRADNVIILNDDFVSTEHALLAYRDGYWWLSDVASTNGTFLNNQPVKRPTALQWGDLVGIGRVRMRLEP